jgi:hypothetical protein
MMHAFLVQMNYLCLSRATADTRDICLFSAPLLVSAFCQVVDLLDEVIP